MSFYILVSRRTSKLPSNLLLNSDNPTDEANGTSEMDANLNPKLQLENVLVVPIQSIDLDCPGMLNEDKVSFYILFITKEETCIYLFIYLFSVY